MNDIMEMCMITALFGALYLLVVVNKRGMTSSRRA